jgi:hypothetical protein
MPGASASICKVGCVFRNLDLYFAVSPLLLDETLGKNYENISKVLSLLIIMYCAGGMAHLPRSVRP